VCADEEPEMRQVSGDHYVACHHPLPPLVPRLVAAADA
jgi:hypothetical protein